MDEFELFRAQAYSGGMPSLPSPSPSPSSSRHLHDNMPGSANARRRRHSSVALVQEAGTDGSDSTRNVLARDRRHRLLANVSAQHQSLDQCGNYDARDAVVSNVTVAIEPPSPTETRRQLNMAAVSSLSTPCTAAAAGDTQHIRDDNDEDCDNAKSNVKRHPDKSPLRRRVTSPEAVIKSLPQAEVTSEVSESITESAVEECLQSVGDGLNHNRQSYLLPMSAVTGSSPGQQSRRTSMCSSLLPAAACGSPRRNSCTGLVQSFSSLPLTPPRPSSRRNSAVTYLPDMPQGRQRLACRIVDIYIIYNIIS